MQYAAPEPVPTAPYASSTVELGDLKRILVRRRFLIIATAALLTLGALLYGLFTPALYSSVSEILIDPQDLQVVTNDVNPSRVPPDGGITMVESQVSVVQSTGVLLRAIQATNLTEDPEFNGQGGLLGRLLGSVLGTGSAETDSTGKTLDALRRRLAVKRADKVLVLDVIVTAKSADKAAKLANAIAQAYLADQASARAKMATDASDSITARLEEQRKRVQQAENAVEAYKSANNMVMAAGNLVSDQELTEINTQLSAAQSRTAALKAQVDQLRRSGGAPDATSEAMRSSVISSLRAQEATLVDQVSQLGTELGPRHPSMIAAQQQLRAPPQDLLPWHPFRDAVGLAVAAERKLAAIGAICVLVDHIADFARIGWVVGPVDDHLADRHLPQRRLAARLEIDCLREAEALRGECRRH